MSNAISTMSPKAAAEAAVSASSVTFEQYTDAQLAEMHALVVNYNPNKSDTIDMRTKALAKINRVQAERRRIAEAKRNAAAFAEKPEEERMRILQADPVLWSVAMLQFEAQNKYERVREQLQYAAKNAQDAAADVLKRLANNEDHRINSLGVLQSSSLDRLCGELRVVVEMRNQVFKATELQLQPSANPMMRFAK
jgi:hypothetical protein